MSYSPRGFEGFFSGKWIDRCEIALRVRVLKEQGKTIATLNGCFDLLHIGHLHMIYEASQLADCLILALNSDESVRRYKGPARPILAQSCRLRMVAALEFVDFVTLFDEADPRDLLAKIKPDIHVNGADYGVDCIEAEMVRSYGGVLHLVDLIPGYSTSAIIQNILQTQTK